MLILSGSGPGWQRVEALTATDNLVRVDTDTEGPPRVGMLILSGSGPGWQRVEPLTANDNLVRVDTDTEVPRAVGMPLLSGSGPGWRHHFLGRSLLLRRGAERRGFRGGFGQSEDAFALIRRMQRFHVRGDFKQAQDEPVRAGCSGNGRGRHAGNGHAAELSGN